MRLLLRFVIATLVGFLVSSLIALAGYALGLWLGRNSDNPSINNLLLGPVRTSSRSSRRHAVKTLSGPKGQPVNCCFGRNCSGFRVLLFRSQILARRPYLLRRSDAFVLGPRWHIRHVGSNHR